MAAPPDPKTLLIVDETRIPSWFSNKYAVIAGAFLGCSTNLARNFFLRAPFSSGIQQTVAFTIIGAVTCYLLRENRKHYYNEKDETLRHYIELHPEDFPTPERKKFQDLFLPWCPHR